MPQSVTLEIRVPIGHSSPANYDNVLGIGAVDSNGIVTNFSDWGFEATNHVYKPDMCAPGFHVHSAVPGGGYALKSGTSMASPLVAGAAALLMQSNPNLTVNPAALRTELLRLVDTSNNNNLANNDAINGYSKIGAGRLDLSGI